uniref:Uncharacterized protein n=1 Tax=Fagus sylvatica TaxID=28930 RepID=A0A2N9GIJ6_FAGSY
MQAKVEKEMGAVQGWLAVYFSKGAISLDMGRLFTGYGIGVFSYVLMIVTGSSVAFLIGSFITWRTLALTGSVGFDLKELFHAYFFLCIYVLFWSLPDGWQRLAIINNLKLRYADFMAKMLILLVKLLKFKYFPFEYPFKAC